MLGLNGFPPIQTVARQRRNAVPDGPVLHAEKPNSAGSRQIQGIRWLNGPAILLHAVGGDGSGNAKPCRFRNAVTNASDARFDLLPRRRGLVLVRRSLDRPFYSTAEDNIRSLR